MAFTGQTIIDGAHALLADINVYWLDTFLLSWLNSGLKEIVLLKPNAYVVNASVKCVAGTKQTIPAAGLMLIDVVRNMGTTDGTTAGKVVIPLSRQSLDSSNPDWHTATASAVTKHYAYDLRYPKSFYVFPPQPVATQGFLEMVYGASPTPLATAADTIVLDDVYENILIDYVAYRAYGRDAADPSHASLSQSHYAAFAAALGARVQSESAIAPVMPVGSRAK